MTTVDPRHSVTAAVREQLAALRARTAGAATPAPGPQVQLAAGSLAQRIRSVDPQDPQRRRKAVRLLLETRIAGVLGSPLLNDAAFGQMLEAIQQQMQQDAQTAGAVEALGEWLCEGGSP